jgi:hypothetical protein
VVVKAKKLPEEDEPSALEKPLPSLLASVKVVSNP